MAQKHDR